MRVSLVVAMAHDGVIGRDGGMPWHLPAELKRFRAITMGKPIVMGRRTHDSIGRALPGRRNIVLSRDPAYRAAEGCEVFPSLDAALAELGDCEEVMIIGGATLYAEALPRATRLHLTEIDAELAGDTWFPAFDRDQWREVASEARGIDADNPLAWRHVVLEREPPVS
ncbi:MAG: dihydrofolate reductase [Gammaproteobacteria bacterium]|jgi:dihydrofolate reductase|nr:dihydrofolate reductase [Gammaproteobacteria bacterium]